MSDDNFFMSGEMEGISSASYEKLPNGDIIGSPYRPDPGVFQVSKPKIEPNRLSVRGSISSFYS